MKAYWDSSALIEALGGGVVRARLVSEGGVTRQHAFAEVFSTLTGGRLGLRVDADRAAEMVRVLGSHLEIVEIGMECFTQALREAKARGVRGGRVYDYLHAVTAAENSCDVIYTLNLSDFEGLFEEMVVEEPGS